jgi:excinuclease UvrABC nuclease subunit
VGTSKCLRERVCSYFADTANRPAKIVRLLTEIEAMEFTPTGSELEALLLERHHIAQRRPLLNRQLNRFEAYTYLVLTREEFPRLVVAGQEPGQEELPVLGQIPGAYFGPFTTRRQAGDALEAVRHLFPLRTCDEMPPPYPAGNACFLWEIGRCSAPCLEPAGRPDYQ